LKQTYNSVLKTVA